MLSISTDRMCTPRAPVSRSIVSQPNDVQVTARAAFRLVSPALTTASPEPLPTPPRSTFDPRAHCLLPHPPSPPGGNRESGWYPKPRLPPRVLTERGRNFYRVHGSDRAVSTASRIATIWVRVLIDDRKKDSKKWKTETPNLGLVHT